MTSIPQVAQALQTVLTTEADQAARQTCFVQRESKLGGAKFAQTLTFGWLANPEATLEELAQTAATLGVSITPQGLDERFTPQAAQCLERVLHKAVEQVITTTPVAIAVLQRFSAVYIQDSTQVQLPAVLAEVWRGSGGGTKATDQTAALKLQVRLDLNRGELSGPFLQEGRGSDRSGPTQRAELPAGALRLADLGYFDLEVLRAMGEQQAYWLSRVQAGTQVFDEKGQALELVRWLAAQEGPLIDCPVQLGAQLRLPCRLVAVRVPQEVANRRRQRLQAEARRRGQAVSRQRQSLADWTLFCTSVPPELLTGHEVLVVARVRWQIELLFKLWKSQGQLAHSRSAKPWRVLCEVYAKLLAVIVQHWLIVTGLWAYPDRSGHKAAQTIRKHALHLASAFVRGIKALSEALTVVQRTLACGCRLNKRKKAPCTFQLLLNLTNGDLA
jgi:hypothetical protein